MDWVSVSFYGTIHAEDNISGERWSGMVDGIEWIINDPPDKRSGYALSFLFLEDKINFPNIGLLFAPSENRDELQKFSCPKNWTV